jgi:competence protein ComEC
LVRFPGGRALLIDAGGLSTAASFDIGDRVVGPVLRRAGVRALDAVVVTHGDADHMGGIASVLRDFPTRMVWDGVPVPPFEPLRQLRERAGRQGVPWMQLQRGDSAVIDGVELAVKHPPLPDWERQDVRNEDSMVIELRWRSVSFVFTGDIGREAEGALSALFAPARVRVVKVPHHGSITSSTDAFIRALAPDVALISVGRANNFGHPSPVVLGRYAAIGARVFRTDQDGAIECSTDGDTLDVRTFTGRLLHVT